VVVKRSTAGYDETVRRVIDAIKRRGLTIFARIDHAGAARQAGLELADEQVVLLGSPRAGTPLMQRDPRIGVELPLRILVWAADDGVQVGYRDPRELSGSYDVSPQLQSTLDQMANLLGDLADEATR
jgi:uncharacterized protein (DUF302 family)